MILLLACSLSRVDQEACTDDAACRAAFGVGSTCGADGYCAEPALESACVQLGADGIGVVDPAVTLLGLDSAGAGGPVGQALTLALTERPELDGATVYAAVCPDTGAMDTAARQLGPKALIGGGTEAEARALYDVAVRSDAVVLSPAATADALTTADGTDATAGRFWRTIGADRTEALALAAALGDQLDAHVLLLHDSDGGPDAIADDFAEAWTAGGGSDLSYAAYEDGAVAGALADRTPGAVEVIVLAATDVAEVRAALSAIGADATLDAAAVWTTTVAYDPALVDGLDAGAQAVLARLHVLGRAAPDPEGAFAARWSTAYAAAPTVDDALAYDAVWLGLYGAYGARIAGDSEGLAVADALTTVSAGERAEVGPDGWSAGSAALAAGGVDLVGASGDIDLDAWGDTAGNLVFCSVDADGAFSVEGRWPS